VGEAVQRLNYKLIKRGGSLMKLARVYVKPYQRITPDGRRVQVDGYWRVQYTPKIRAASDIARSRAEEREPRVTKAMEQAADRTGGRLVGLEFRLKETKSIRRKVESRLDENEGDPYVTAQKLSDTLRYTMTYPTETYSSGVRRTLSDLEKQGYQMRTKNYWKPGDAYQGVNVAMRTPDDFPVELQFHTPESLDAKERMHGLYEQFREVDVKPKRKRELWDQMVAVAGTIPVPPGIEGLPTEIVEPYEDAPGITGLTTSAPKEEKQKS
jgi:hypothetical protein